MNPLVFDSLSGVVAFFSMVLSAFSGGGGTAILIAYLVSTVPGSYVSTLALAKLGSFALIISAAATHLRQKRPIHLGALAVMMGGGLTGIWIATYLLKSGLSDQIFVALIPWIILGTAAVLWFFKGSGTVDRKLTGFEPWRFLEIFLVFAGLNVIAGVSGGIGTLFGAYLVIRHRFSYIQAVAHGMISGFFVHGSQTVFLVATEPVNFRLALFVVVGSLLGGWAGTRLQYFKGNSWVKRVAIFVMVAVGLRLLFI
jgi:uncharacterized membrane protein YfcA